MDENLEQLISITDDELNEWLLNWLTHLITDSKQLSYLS